MPCSPVSKVHYTAQYSAVLPKRHPPPSPQKIKKEKKTPNTNTDIPNQTYPQPISKKPQFQFQLYSHFKLPIAHYKSNLTQPNSTSISTREPDSDPHRHLTQEESINQSITNPTNQKPTNQPTNPTNHSHGNPSSNLFFPKNHTLVPYRTISCHIIPCH